MNLTGSAPPAECDIAVVGGGILGLATARKLGGGGDERLYGAGLLDAAAATAAKAG